MSKRTTVFLNGAAFKRPLIGLGLSSMASGLFIGSHSHILLISLLLVMVNTGMLLACKSSFGRWLGRNQLPQVGLALSLLGFGFACLISMPYFAINNPLLSMLSFMGGVSSFGAAFGSLLVTGVNFSYYTEDSHGQMIEDGNDYYGFAYVVWKSLLNAKKICSGDKLMRRGWFGSSLIREAKGLEWLAWHADNVGDDTIVVFGPDIASARQSAAQLMNVAPEMIVIAPREMYAAYATKLHEAAQQQKARYQAIREEEERQRLIRIAEVAVLQAQICPENSPFLLEDHAIRMDRLFAQAIGANSDFASINKNQKDTTLP
jgi:hypothetical protein